MIPVTTILKIAKAAKKWNKKVSEAKASAKEKKSNNKEEEKKESTGRGISDQSTVSIEGSYGPIDLSGILGAGYITFEELSLDSLKLWSEALKILNPKVSSNETIQLPDGSQVEEVSITSTIPLRVDETANATSAASAQETEPLNSDSSGLLLVFLLGVVAYFGVKLVFKNGKPSLTINKDNARSAIDKFTEGKSSEKPSIYMPTFHYGEQGSIKDRLGLAKYRISTPYTDYSSFHGRAHHAIDIAAPEGTPIVAPSSGVVTFVRRNAKDAGNYIEFRGDDGVGYRLLHLYAVDVKPGQRFETGQQIARVGNTGHSSGAHLHLDVYTGADKIKVGETMFNNKKLTRVNPLSIGSLAVSREDYQAAEGKLEAGPVPIHVNYTKPTAVGTQGYNYLSIQGDIAWEGRNGYIFTDDGRYFPTFSSADYGIRAGAMNLIKYQTKHDVSSSGSKWTTIADIAQNSKGHNYVTSKNGDRVGQWVTNVSRGSGYTPEQRVDLTDPQQLANVVKGIAFAEHSVTLQPEEVEQVIRYYNLLDGIPSNKQ